MRHDTGIPHQFDHFAQRAEAIPCGYMFRDSSIHCLSLVTSETSNNNKYIIGSPSVSLTDIFSQFAQAHFRQGKELSSILPIL
jgi:hypothetical protein